MELVPSKKFKNVFLSFGRKTFPNNCTMYGVYFISRTDFHSVYGISFNGFIFFCGLVWYFPRESPAPPAAGYI
jgi:hypothetical protein